MAIVHKPAAPLLIALPLSVVGMVCAATLALATFQPYEGPIPRLPAQTALERFTAAVPVSGADVEVFEAIAVIGPADVELFTSAAPYVPAHILDDNVSLPQGRPPHPNSMSANDRAKIIELDEARRYLLRTATPGGTMTRLGPERAIAMLHPRFVVRLAKGVRKMRAAGYRHFGIFSAYRPPAFRVGGFRNKKCSSHSYGISVDVKIDGGPRSREAYRWAKIVREVGLYLPYGPRNGAEYNHTQLLPRRSYCGYAYLLPKRGRAPKTAAQKLRIWRVADVAKGWSRPHKKRRYAKRSHKRRVHKRRHVRRHVRRLRHHRRWIIACDRGGCYEKRIKRQRVAWR